MDNNYIYSDIRYKCNICDTCNLLDKLDNISFVSYNRIDINNDSLCTVGVIAQNIKSVVPNIVKTTKGFIPNIYGSAEHSLISDNIVFIRKIYDYEVKHNENIKIRIKKENMDGEIVYVTPILNPTGVSFEVQKWRDYSDLDIITIIGTEVDDFHYINFTELTMLGTACTKELYQIVKQQASTISTLQNQLNQVVTWASAQGFTLTQ